VVQRCLLSSIVDAVRTLETHRELAQQAPSLLHIARRHERFCLLEGYLDTRLRPGALLGEKRLRCRADCISGASRFLLKPEFLEQRVVHLNVVDRY